MARIKAFIRSLIGTFLYDRLAWIYRVVRYGKSAFYIFIPQHRSMVAEKLILCNFCGTVFIRSGPNHSEFLVCPHCGKCARERTALFCLLHELGARLGRSSLFLNQAVGAKSLRLLECSPRAGDVSNEIYTANLGSYTASDYDLSAHKAQIKLDLTNSEDIASLAASFDVILCAHVLEHIPEYTLALQNLYKLLAPGGILILQVPVLEAAYTPVTWDEFHGDNTRVFHRFGFDLCGELDKFFDQVEIMLGQLDFTITSPEIAPGKYAYIPNQRAAYFEAGEHLMEYLGLGCPDLCEAFICRKHAA